MSVVRGQEARLTWKFSTNKTLYFHGIVWTIKDRVFKNDTKLLWIDRYEKLYRHSHTKNRHEYDVGFTSDTMLDGGVQLTIVILKAEHIHENRYVCHVIRPGRDIITPSEIELEVTPEPINSGNIPTVANSSNISTEIEEPAKSLVQNAILTSLQDTQVPFVEWKQGRFCYSFFADNLAFLCSRIKNCYKLLCFCHF